MKQMLGLMLFIWCCEDAFGNPTTWCTSTTTGRPKLKCWDEAFNKERGGPIECTFDDPYCYTFHPNPDDEALGIPKFRSCIKKEDMCKDRRNIISEYCMRQPELYYTKFNIQIPGGKVCYCDSNLCNDISSRKCNNPLLILLTSVVFFYKCIGFRALVFK